MIDLHMHSCYSDDGEFTPAKLMERCAAGGIRMMSITDHNTVRANEEARTLAKKLGISYIPGIEIDCVFQGINFHVLGYGIDDQSQDFCDIENCIDAQNFETSLKMLVKTQELGFHITENDMSEISKECYWQDRWTGEMFAEVLLKKEEYRNHPLLLPYRIGGIRSDNPYVNFYWDFYSQGKVCYVQSEYPPMETVIDVIHRNHGMAILAHPGVNLRENETILPAIVELGIDGIEAFSSYHTPEQSADFYQKANALGICVTCGSDFHGKTKPSIHLGKISYPSKSDYAKIELEIEDKMRAMINR